MQFNLAKAYSEAPHYSRGVDGSTNLTLLALNPATGQLVSIGLGQLTADTNYTNKEFITDETLQAILLGIAEAYYFEGSMGTTWEDNEDELLPALEKIKELLVRR